MDWYEINFSREDLTNLNEFQKDFAMAMILAENPAGLSVFCLFMPDLREEKYFLPPVAQQYCPEILTKYLSKPCQKPGRDSVRIAIGDGEDYDFWFPRSEDN